MKSNIITMLTSKDDKCACAYAEKIISESHETDVWYDCFEEFASLLNHPKSLVRNRALNILAANAQWDSENKFDLIMTEYLSHITDEKPITARQCIKALAQAGKAKPQYIPLIRVLKEAEDQVLYIALQNKKRFLIREYETKEGFEACMDAHMRLGRIGIRTPEQVAFADDFNICVEKYVTGTPVSELIMRGDLPEKFLVQIKDMAEKCESEGIVLDYYPTNYIVCGKTLVYTGCKYYERTEKNSYEKAGYSFWAKPAELIRCMANGEKNRLNKQEE